MKFRAGTSSPVTANLSARTVGMTSISLITRRGSCTVTMNATNWNARLATNHSK